MILLTIIIFLKGVGKTTLVRALSGNFQFQNLSTNGVDISLLSLSSSISVIDKLIRNQKEQQVQFNIWDFGGQSVFHSTHRFFTTSNAIYLILYDASKPETQERLKYVLVRCSSKSDIIFQQILD